MIESTFESLSHVRPSKQYSKLTARRLEILEQNIVELKKYHDKCCQNKKSAVKKLIDRYFRVYDRLSKTLILN